MTGAVAGLLSGGLRIGGGRPRAWLSAMRDAARHPWLLHAVDLTPSTLQEGNLALHAPASFSPGVTLAQEARSADGWA